jgi:ABC-type cobalt transport system substrate-binding protein
MKHKDVALILVIAIVSGIFALVVSQLLFGGAKHKQSAEVVDSINANFLPPDTTYFNAKSVDPTQLITIGNSTNTDPFNGQPH